ncbi:MAG: hypothetical protein R3229_11175 [Alphaproteobacteria bacterium]|nr:hypothetical protein [Alphaproteobacteria bacterium]
MTEESINWLQVHWNTGVILCGKCRELRTAEDLKEWAAEAEGAWLEILLAGLKKCSPGDEHRIDPLHKLVFPDPPLAEWHLWHEPTAAWPRTSATGEGCPADNPFNRHYTRLEKVKEILDEWRATRPRDLRPLKIRIPEALARAKTKYPDFSETKIRNLVAQELGCDESRVRQVIKEQGL